MSRDILRNYSSLNALGFFQALQFTKMFSALSVVNQNTFFVSYFLDTFFGALNEFKASELTAPAVLKCIHHTRN